ncbi:uncharacterized membrane protein YheB (UPF0754 family) [Geomicrobium halophilum]|uniref:Uncharacterized membrane protein YheB (UPF0754 family) n=1 Tax=Geomicrobium halophilum TaxID=549000 RepID=A0A841PP28_9BACL|nr:DUF445 family protein [Geomicrobium halophilum]MBB6449554.1 uncharacterized membrane protein YheB (UPF0754 family) [Geomicrobium halophilum]
MNGWLLLLFTVALAALIGFVTNIIAVSMLFRPRKPMYIGSWKLPFTPGLIPKRHDEIAHHLGRVVMEHLLTVEGLQGRLTERAFQEEVKAWVKEGGKRWLVREERSIQEIAEHYSSWSSIDERVEERVESAISRRLDQYFQEWQDQPVAYVVPDSIIHKGTDAIPEVSRWILHRLRIYLYSEEGKANIKAIVETFIRRRGSIIQMLGSLVRTEKMIERVYPEVVEALTSTDIERWLEAKLHEEYEKVLQKEVTEFLSAETVEKYRMDIVHLITQQVPIQDILHKPVKDWAEHVDFTLLDQVTDTVVHQAGRFLEVRLSGILKALQLDTIVTNQVKAFPLPRLEEIVKNISKRELQMIKYLGGILGGLIGFLQGIILIGLL